MTDYFALLQEIRRPWLDTGLLKQKFLTLSAAVHPDKIQSASDAEKQAAAGAFAALNSAHANLAEPKTRLQHLLELELVTKPQDIQQIPAQLADLFAEVANTCRQTDGFLAERARATSPLVQVQYFARGEVWEKQLNTLRDQLSALHGQLLERLQLLDQRWQAAAPGARPTQYPALEELFRLFSYLNRWNTQIQERLTQIAQFPLP